MGSSAVFTRTYDETLDLLVEARNYMTYLRPKTRVRTAWVGQELVISCEALRVTSRLTQVMAWLMIQRAAMEGEVTLSEACGESHRLAAQDVCLDVSARDNAVLPTGLQSLLDRSLGLYQRAARLERMVLTRAAND